MRATWLSLMLLFWPAKPLAAVEEAAEAAAPSTREKLDESYASARKILDAGASGKGQLAEAISLLEEVANSKAGNDVTAAAMRDLGELYLQGVDGGVLRRDWNRALSLLEGAAGLGDAAAAHFMAYTMSTGAELFARQYDEHAAAALEESAALRSYIPAVRALAWRYKEGVGTRKDCETALLLYKDAAAAAVAEVAEPLLEVSVALSEGDYLRDGDLAKRRTQERFDRQLREYYEQMADVGEVSAASEDALYELGRMLERGTHGMPKNTTKAAKYYRAAVDGSASSRASASLGYLLAVGDGVKQNIDEAMDFLEFASAQGELRATALLGYIHQHGAGVDEDPAKARALYTEAAQGDEPLALYCLAELLLQEESYYEALTYFARAAEAGLLVAAQQLAHMFELGIGARRSCHDAVELYKLAAETGSCAAAVHRGVKLAASPATEEAALVALTRSAAEGVEVAQTNAAWMLARRRGWRGSGALPAALRLYKLAAAQGSTEAEAELGRILYQAGDAAAAAKHLATAAKAGHMDATMRLARMLEAGRGVRQDLGQAEQLYKHLLHHTPLRIGEWGALARKAGLSARLIQIRAKAVFAGALAAIRRAVAPKKGSGGGGGGGPASDSSPPAAAAASRERQRSGGGGADDSVSDGRGGGVGGGEERALVSNLFFLMVGEEEEGTTGGGGGNGGGGEHQCINVYGRRTECDEGAIWTMSGTRGREALVSFWERPEEAGAAALSLTASPASASSDSPASVGAAPLGKDGAAAGQTWHIEADRLTTDRGERCLTLLPRGADRAAEGALAVQSSVKGCATVEVYEVPPFLIESEDSGGCFDGAFFVRCDTLDMSLRWDTQLMDAANGGQYSLYKAMRSDDGHRECLLLEGGELKLGSCSSKLARGWSLAQGRLSAHNGESCLAAEDSKIPGGKDGAAIARGVMRPCAEGGHEPLGLRF